MSMSSLQKYNMTLAEIYFFTPEMKCPMITNLVAIIKMLLILNTKMSNY